jgi:hypothetical protein
LPPDAQAKLLRALQEGKFERRGGKDSVASNFRLIAATKFVRDGFRQCLLQRFRAAGGQFLLRRRASPLNNAKTPACSMTFPSARKCWDIRLLVIHDMLALDSPKSGGRMMNCGRRRIGLFSPSDTCDGPLSLMCEARTAPQAGGYEIPLELARVVEFLNTNQMREEGSCAN